MENHLIDEIIENLFPAQTEPSGDTTESQSKAAPGLSRQEQSRLLDEAEYFLDVLGCAYDQAIRPHDHDGCTGRARRVELGIDVPELDVVCLWATRNESGISVPCVDFMTFQVVARLCGVLTALEAGGSADWHKFKADLDWEFRGLLAALPDSRINRDYPVLCDRFLPPEVLETWCTQGGDIRRLLGSCKGALGMEIFS